MARPLKDLHILQLSLSTQLIILPLALLFSCSNRMSQGRGSAVAAVMVVCLVMALHYEVAEAATYTVGGANGWTFNVATWPKGKRFRAGDILVFNYDPTVHSVVAVNKAGYGSCVAPRGAKAYKTGKDQIKLVKGPNFFVCGFTDHCQSGMKIAVNAL